MRILLTTRGALLFQARLALSIIVGNNKFNASMAAFQKPKSNTGDLSGLEHQHDFEEQGSSFRQHIHDVFMDSFSRNMLDQVGIRLLTSVTNGISKVHLLFHMCAACSCLHFALVRCRGHRHVN